MPLKVELVRDAAALTAPFHYEGRVLREGTRESDARGEPGDSGNPGEREDSASSTDEVYLVSAVVAADGAVTVVASDPTIAERVRLLLRACYKQSVSEGLSAPPRKIVRWREERV